MQVFSNAVKAIWSIFCKEHDFELAKERQRLILWGMTVHRPKFKTCKVLEVYWIFVGFNQMFMGSVYLGHPA